MRFLRKKIFLDKLYRVNKKTAFLPLPVYLHLLFSVDVFWAKLADEHKICREL